MTNNWARRVIGKLVLSPGGPTKCDYRTTGRSASPPFPELGSAVGFPALGISDHEKWEEYSRVWPEGGLYLRPVPAPDGVYLVASRLRPYLDRPHEANSRFFVETVHAAQLVSALDFSCLFQLPSQLHTDPLIELDSDLPPLVLAPNTPVVLPGDWFQRCRPLLVAVASRSPLLTTDRGLSPGQFFEQALWALCCLPAALRWRVMVAAGVYSIPEFSKSQLQGSLTLAYQGQATAIPASDSPGESYARWFADATDQGRRCRTIEDVYAAVAAKFPTLVRWDDLPPSERFDRAIRIVDEVPRIQALQGSIHIPSAKLPILRDIVHLRFDVLDALSTGLGAPTDQRDHLISEVASTEWSEAWERFVAERPAVSGQMLAIGSLLGALKPLDPALIALELPRLELPGALVAGISRRLSAEFKQAARNGQLDAWKGLLESAFADPRPPWFGEWGQTNQYCILWNAVKLALLDGTDVTHRWNTRDCGAARAVRAVLQRENAVVSDFSGMIANIPADHGPTALKLAEFVEESHPELALRIALAAPLTDWLDQRANRASLATASDGWIRALVAVGRSDVPTDRRVARSLLAIWDRFQPDERAALRRPLQPLLGSLDSLLFEKRIAAETVPTADWVWQCVREWVDREPGFGPQIVADVSRNPELVGPNFRERLLEPLLATTDCLSLAASECASLQFALELQSGRAKAYEALSGKDLFSAELWTTLFREAPCRPEQSELVLTSIGQFPIATLYRRAVPKFPPQANGSFWKEWLAMVRSEPPVRDWYLRYVREAGLEDQPLWRFVSGWQAIGKLYREETKVIHENRLVEDLLRAVVSGAVTTDTIASVLEVQSITKGILSSVCESFEDVETLYRRCSEAPDECSDIAFWDHVLEQLSPTTVSVVQRRVRRGLVPTLVRAIKSRLWPHRLDGDWMRLAITIYENSERPVQEEMVKRIAQATP